MRNSVLLVALLIVVGECALLLDALWSAREFLGISFDSWRVAFFAHGAGLLLLWGSLWARSVLPAADEWPEWLVAMLQVFIGSCGLLCLLGGAYLTITVLSIGVPVGRQLIKVEQQGTLSITRQTRESVSGQVTYSHIQHRQSDVHLDADTLLYQVRSLVEGRVSEERRSLDLAGISRLDVRPIERSWSEADEQGGHTSLQYQAVPPVFAVEISLSNGERQELELADAGEANQVAIALARGAGRARHWTGAFGRTVVPVALLSAPGGTMSTWIPEQKLALVVGNSGYNNEGPWADLLQGPEKDVEAMADRLRQLRFEVVAETDLDLEQMREALKAFRLRIAANPDAVALFYYSGHGLQAPRGPGAADRDNYLVPAHSTLADEADAWSLAVSLGEVRDALQAARGGVVILDTCRSNGLERGLPSLAAVGARTGMLLAYSTAAGGSAVNRPGQPSRYTQLLVDELKAGRGVVSLMQVFTNVRRKMVEQGMPGEQLPEVLNQLNEDIVLAQP